MAQNEINGFEIDYLEMYVFDAKPVIHWHVKALGFEVTAYSGHQTGNKETISYVVEKGDVRIVITAPSWNGDTAKANEVNEFVRSSRAGIQKIAVKVDSVQQAFKNAIANGAIPVLFPRKTGDEHGSVEEASVRLFNRNEIVYINRSSYKGIFRPSYARINLIKPDFDISYTKIDHLACHLKVNEKDIWAKYFFNAIGFSEVQRINKSADNKSGMLLSVLERNKESTKLVLAEPDINAEEKDMDEEMEKFGHGFHHVGIATNDIFGVVEKLKGRGVEFTPFPNAYYELLKKDSNLDESEIEAVKKHGLLIRKEGDAALMQVFIMPFSDNPFFIYEIVQRVNGYSGFAIQNINLLRLAEKMEIFYGTNADT